MLASNNEMVILPVNEPTFGTPRKSQIQTYLEQNEVGHHRVLSPHNLLGCDVPSDPAYWANLMALCTRLACRVQGPGLQHLALKTNDVVATLRKMRRVSACGGFDFMPPLDKSYYQ